jgi:hypothetical protein
MVSFNSFRYKKVLTYADISNSITVWLLEE